MKSNMAKAASCLQSLKKNRSTVQKCSFARVSTREGGLKVICARSSQSLLSNRR
jgi:hypothetical protein